MHPGTAEAAGTPAVAFREACRYWFKLGCISFGGPAGQISMMHAELVERRRWISDRRFLHALNFTMVLPGPEAQQLATYIGWLMHGTAGGIVAGSLFVLPSLVLLFVLAWLYMALGDVAIVGAILYGVKPVVTAIVIHAAWRIGRRALAHPLLYSFALAAFLLLTVFDVPFPWIIGGAAAAGWAGGRFLPEAFARPSAHVTAPGVSGTALIGDDTPLPAHAGFRWRSVTAYLLVGVALWCAVEGTLAFAFGWHGPLAQLGWFFTKAALLTFGGAYAVLPYVYQGAVEDHGWVTAGQMMDGLALGETTPGPLVMVNAFVGFVAGWNLEIAGAEHLVAGAAGSMLLVTFMTFLPSFVFVLVGAPAVEATRHNLAFAAPLAGITAAVVGVIANLALLFAIHVLWPEGSGSSPLAGAFDAYALLIMVLALFALVRLRLGIIPVIGLGAGLGIARLGLLAVL